MRRTSKTLQDDYWAQSTQPLYCLIFVAPLLILYEVGVAWLGPGAMRNGADVWLRESLAWLGFGQYLFLPLVTCGCLLAWHHVSRHDWKLCPRTLSGMVCESFVTGVAVIVVAQIAGYALHWTLNVGPDATSHRIADRVPYMLSFLGAGIYEELLFRLLLFSGAIVGCQKLGVDRRSAVTFAIVASSLLFAAAHYRLFFHVGLDFTWYSFLFRAAAGVVLSVLFLYRGFGIVVGAHAVYDILVATLMQ